MQLSAMQSRVSGRLDEMAGPVYYPLATITAALNEACRFFALLTLGLETTATFALTPAATWYHMLSDFPDWLLPLRVYRNDGVEVRTARVEDLDSLDAGWRISPGDPVRYAALGFDLLALYHQPADAASLNVTYARAPVPLVNASDEPEFPEEYHPALIDYAVYVCRLPEGAQEFAKTLPYFSRFLSEAQRYADYVRARNIGARYEKRPFALERFDRSRLFAARPDLVPRRSAK